jgi:hypothetical protein
VQYMIKCKRNGAGERAVYDQVQAERYVCGA